MKTEHGVDRTGYRVGRLRGDSGLDHAGYGTMAMEADEQLEEYGCDRPTHVFVQAGVGSLAGAVQGYFANRYPENPPKVVVVEADVAPVSTRARLPATEASRSWTAICRPSWPV